MPKPGCSTLDAPSLTPRYHPARTSSYPPGVASSFWVWVSTSSESDAPAAVSSERLQQLHLSSFTLSGFTLSGFTLSGFALSGFALGGFALSGFALGGFAPVASLSVASPQWLRPRWLHSQWLHSQWLRLGGLALGLCPWLAGFNAQAFFDHLRDKALGCLPNHRNCDALPLVTPNVNKVPVGRVFTGFPEEAAAKSNRLL